MTALFGRLFLGFIRSVHRWHRGHVRVSLTLILMSASLALLQMFGLTHRELADLPLKWEHYLGIASVLLFSLYPAIVFTARIAARYWPPPVLKLIAILPRPLAQSDPNQLNFDDIEGNFYQFRYAIESDLDTFCSFAMADPAIVTTFSFLQPHDWFDLYARWLSADPKNFMVLERRSPRKANWDVVAVSIVLRLKSEAAGRIWTGELTVVELTAKHLSLHDRSADPLLLDLVALNRHTLDKVPELVFALPKLHLAKRSSHWGNKKLELWIEPVHHTLPKILERIGFDGPHRTSEHLGLYRWEVPLNKRRTTELQRETTARLIENILECAKWPIS